MQVVDSEIVIPLKYKPRLKKILIRSCVFLVFLVGIFTYLILLSSYTAARTSRFPEIQNTTHTIMVLSIVFLFLILLFYGLLFIYLIRKLRGPSPQLRINREGIFTSHDSFLIRWEEVKELSPSTYMSYPLLRIIPWDSESLVSRAKASSGRLRCFLIDISQFIARRSTSLAPLAIPQQALPISIGELMTAIQEHFAPELRKYHITMLGSQS